MKIKPETWFERFVDLIDPCRLRGPCLASYGCRWTWFRTLYWGRTSMTDRVGEDVDD